MERKFWSGVILVLFSLPFVMASCHYDESVITRRQYQKYLQQSVLIIPDSLMSKEQRLLKVKINDIVCNSVIVENNRLQFTADRDCLEKEGIPSYYYDIIKYQCKETSDAVNEWIRKGALPSSQGNLDSLMNMYIQENTAK